MEMMDKMANQEYRAHREIMVLLEALVPLVPRDIL